MENRTRNGLLTALLGVLIGFLLFAVADQLRQRRGTKAEYANWQKLNVILNEVRKNYVDTVDVEKLTDAAVVAALAKLDPHTIYLPPEELQTSETELAGNFDGIGIQFNVPNDTAIVLEVIPGGPAEKAGMLQGDRLMYIDDVPVAGVKFPQDSMVRRMKGPSGTKVKVTVLRDREEIPFDITRGKIPVHCVDAAFMVDDSTGYLRLSKFSRNTYKEVLLAATELLSKGMTRMVFDLRDNTGGYFDQALSLADMFLDKGDEIVYLQGLNRKRDDYKATGKGLLRHVKLSVLINESSASSSEIFAGAIQDNDRGVIVGRRSYGKGLVQEPVFFTDGSGIRITVARFYTPSGRCIQKPYSDDYDYDIYKRYASGEFFASDSIHVDSSAVFTTCGGRKVYGGGGIIPDVFVPMDTTRATSFYIESNAKALPMRYASATFDRYRNALSDISEYDDLLRFLDSIDIASGFREYALRTEGLKAGEAEWKETEPYLLPQLRALVGRYSRLGENAFYKLYLDTDLTVQVALESPFTISTETNDQ